MERLPALAPADPEEGDSPRFVHVASGEGSAVWLNGDVYSVKIGKEESGGQLGLLEASVPPGGGPPMHNHLNEDEAFYILEGELEIYIGDRTITGRTGDFVFIPRATMHGFRNKRLHPARQLLIFTPGGFERFFLEAGVEAKPGVPVPQARPEDNWRAVEAGHRHGSYQADTAD